MDVYNKVKTFLFQLEFGISLLSKIERRETVEYYDTQPLRKFKSHQRELMKKNWKIGGNDTVLF